MKNNPTKTPLSSEDRGFALIVTISLMLLLTVIAVGLLTLSSITLRSSTATSAMAEARQNARLALMLALGELQKQTGPDQRVTAVADIAGDANGLPLAAGAAPGNNLSVNGDPKGLSSVLPGTRYWTGVWSNNSTANPSGEIYTKTPSVKFQQWLVSGNETGTTPYTPASVSCGVDTTGKVPDIKTAVVMAGTNSVGAAGTNYTRFVSAPVIGINTSVSGTTKSIGRYAWWVGDEGVKSRINMKVSYPKDTTATYPLLTAQRRGWESVSGFQKYPVPGADTNLPNAVTLSEASLLDSSLITPGGGTPLQLAFHSATADSYGVLADTVQGGLKLDLTACLSKMTAVTSDFANTFNPANNIIPTAVPLPPDPKSTPITAPLQGPKWQQLKDFQTFAASAASAGVLNAGTITGAAGALAPQGSGKSALNVNLPAAGLPPGSPVIAPVIVDIRFVLGAQWEVPDSTQPTVYGFRPCAKLSLVLANPYPYPLNFKDLDLEVIDETPSGNAPSRVYVSVPTGDTSGPSGGQNYPLIDRNQASSLFQKTNFRISASSLAPGASRAYTVGAFTDVTLNRTVPMVEMTAAADPLNMGICARGALSSSRYTFGPNSNVSLDIRENLTTSTPSVELRLAGSAAGTNVLRRIERFEFDNGAFVPTQRHFGDHDAPGSPQLYNVANWKKPFGMQLYGYQMSLPGADYFGSYLPTVAGNSRGARGATRRLYADFNLQALRYGKPIACYSPPPYFMMQRDSYADFNTVASVGTSFANMPAPQWARSATSGSATGVFFGFPSTFVSLAQFQHADLTANDFFLSVAHEPGNALGNSYATPFVMRGSTSQTRTDYYVNGPYSRNATTTVVGTTVKYYDISHLLNTALWDTYFLSTMQATGTTLNPSIQKINPKDTSPDLQDPVKASSRLLVNGALNVNATEKDAWKALLSSAKFLKHPKDDASADTANAMFPRSLDMISPSKVPATGTDADSLSGFRRLTPDQIDALATELTRQVRMRGPFVSLSQFVNRALVTLVNDTNGLGRSGALQSAIDQCAKININVPSALNPSVTCSFTGTSMKMTDEPVVVPVNGTRNEADLIGSNPALANPDDALVWPSTSRDQNMGTAGSIFADRDSNGDILSSTYAKELGYRSTGIPGWLTQADVLQVIGPSLSARSDTFRIRAYGEALDSNGNTSARAWCEAVVQRTPNYVDSTDAPQTVAAKLVSKANQLYGRKYSIISFRWLSSNEI